MGAQGVNPDMKILVVDGFHVMRIILRTQLKELGCEQVREAETPDQALSRLRLEPFDLMICDWNMSQMDGGLLFKEIRGDERLKALPILVLAGKTEEKEAKSVKSKDSDYIIKPFKVPALKRKMKQLCDTL